MEKKKRSTMDKLRKKLEEDGERKRGKVDDYEQKLNEIRDKILKEFEKTEECNWKDDLERELESKKEEMVKRNEESKAVILKYEISAQRQKLQEKKLKWAKKFDKGYYPEENFNEFIEDVKTVAMRKLGESDKVPRDCRKEFVDGLKSFMDETAEELRKRNSRNATKRSKILWCFPKSPEDIEKLSKDIF